MKIGTAILSFILTTLILFNSMRVSLTFSYYKIDPIGFIEQLCENKDKPELACNGKCHLKKITESNSEDSNLPNQLIDFKEILLYYVNSTKYSFELKTIEQKSKTLYNNHYSFLNEYDHFHPPKYLFLYS